jgi:hypothetical protein
MTIKELIDILTGLVKSGKCKEETMVVHCDDHGNFLTTYQPIIDVIKTASRRAYVCVDTSGEEKRVAKLDDTVYVDI